MPQPPATLPELILTKGRLVARDRPPIAVTSQALDWPGMLLEVGANGVKEADEVLLAQHYVGLNIDTEPVTLEVKGAHGFRRFTLAPQTIWVCPRHEPLTLRVDSERPSIRVSFDAQHLGRLLGQAGDAPIHVRQAFGVACPQIAHLVRALAVEAVNRNPGGLALVEAMTTALGHLLVRQVGVERLREERAGGGLSPAAKRRALEMMHACLDARLTVDALAREVGLSPAHFARAFKETLGCAPHRYLLSLRLERARRLLETTDAGPADIAHRLGFADQSHLNRLFKRAFGITPGAIVRDRRR